MTLPPSKVLPKPLPSAPFPINFGGGVSKVAVVCSVLLCLTGCANPGRFHQQMRIAARPNDGVQQTQLAHLGQVVTDKGTFQVATQFRVLTDMAAPRGMGTRLLLFDSSANLVASYQSVFAFHAVPLWCEGSRLYMAGFGSWNVGDTLQAVEADPRLVVHRGKFRFGDPYSGSITGNVLDFKRGPTKPLLTRETRYGSSGGTEDDAWELVDPQKSNIP